MRNLIARACSVGLAIPGALGLTAAVVLPNQASAQVSASPPYEVSLFAANPSHTSQADSIVVWKNSVIVGFENHVAKDGTDGKSSTLVEFGLNGEVKRTFSVKGHNDGLRVVGDDSLWALQNEDANPNLVVIDLESGKQTLYTFAPTPHGGGYDDIVVFDGEVYLTASNPNLNAQGVNVFPALVRAKLWMDKVMLEPILMGDAQAIDIATGGSAQLNLTDPDSMTKDLNGDIVFVSQADSELIFVSHAGTPEQTVGRLAVTSPITTAAGGPLTLDDTDYARADSGYLLVTDIGSATAPGGIYKIKRKNFGFDTGQAYSASDTYGIVGTLNVDDGAVTPIVSGLQSARGLAFVRKNAADHRGTRDHHDEDRHDSGDRGE